MEIFKCKICGGSLEIGEGQTVTTCEYCGTRQTLPRLDDERRRNLYDRANHFRRNNDFDKAQSIYESILEEDTKDAEAYWSIVLCRFGVEYVEDPKTHTRVPTVNRTQLTSIFDDENYKSAIEYADVCQREIYRADANIINEIQKKILAISESEEPFDVFICYKETDSLGGRSRDSVLAQELYYELVEEGFKVFFSRITLEDKLGTAYEPYIFSALTSAKVMVALGTKREHFSAVWVKNEWSRFLSLIAEGEDKVLIPAYKDMDPYDLPEEFSHLQAQDMSKLGFMQDLVRGIKKIIGDNTQKSTPVGASGAAAPLLERAFIFIEDGDFTSGDEYLEKVLNIEPKCAEAYLGKLMIDMRVKSREKLALVRVSYAENLNYKRAKRFGSKELIKELDGYLNEVLKREAARIERQNMIAERELRRREEKFENRENVFADESGSSKSGHKNVFADEKGDSSSGFEDVFSGKGKYNLTVKRGDQFHIWEPEIKMEIEGQTYHIKEETCTTIQVDGGKHTIVFSSFLRKARVKLNITGDTDIEISVDKLTGQINTKIEQFRGMSIF